MLVKGVVPISPLVMPTRTPNSLRAMQSVAAAPIRVASSLSKNAWRSTSSSTSVYGIPDHHPLLETDRLQGVSPYGEAKAEKHCLSFRARGNCVPVLRPKSFVGPERLGVFELLYDWAYEGRNFRFSDRGNTNINC